MLVKLLPLIALSTLFVGCAEPKNPIQLIPAHDANMIMAASFKDSKARKKTKVNAMLEMVRKQAGVK